MALFDNQDQVLWTAGIGLVVAACTKLVRTVTTNNKAIAVLETSLNHLQADVSDIKHDNIEAARSRVEIAGYLKTLADNAQKGPEV